MEQIDCQYVILLHNRCYNMMGIQTDILIIGGGLAGLTAALHLRQEGMDVILMEKMPYPHHKVCGEYVSNEILPYLQWLDADPLILHPTLINKISISTLAGKSITAKLPLGGFGVSRYTLDNFLYQKFITKGGRTINDTVVSVAAAEEYFLAQTISGRMITAKQVIGAYGKRSGIDLQLKRKFIQTKSPFLAVKAHYEGEFDDNLVALHNFNGGYCGVSKVEDQKINICYLADYASFMKYKSTAAYQQNVLYQNKALKRIFESSRLLFEKPLTISQLAFGQKETVVNHILMIGDTAGLIHPLCGNGMAMAIHSAKICAELVVKFFQGAIESRAVLEKHYQHYWNSNFKSRLRMGTALSVLLRKEKLSDLMMRTMVAIPAILPVIIKKTHGKPLTLIRNEYKHYP